VLRGKRSKRLGSSLHRRTFRRGKKKKGGRSLARGARRLPPQREMPSGGLMQATPGHFPPKRRWLALCPSCIRPGLGAGHRRRRSGLEKGLALCQGYTWSSAGGYLPKVSCDAVSRRVAVVSGKPITKPDGGEAGHEIYWARGVVAIPGVRFRVPSRGDTCGCCWCPIFGVVVRVGLVLTDKQPAQQRSPIIRMPLQAVQLCPLMQRRWTPAHSSWNVSRHPLGPV
jgi:hypothetical protein